MFKRVSFVLVIITLFIISECSNTTSTNKANLDEEVYEKGAKLVQYNYMWLNDEKVPQEEAKQLSKWFNDKVEIGEFASEEGELFLKTLQVLDESISLAVLESAKEQLYGESDGSDISSNEIEQLFKEIEDQYGISYKKWFKYLFLGAFYILLTL